MNIYAQDVITKLFECSKLTFVYSLVDVLIRTFVSLDVSHEELMFSELFECLLT